jgi:exopolyphosphatase/pppGpp-phosphohydrolase
MFTDGRPQVISLKHRLLERWVARRLGSIAHERRVVAIGRTLFDLTLPLHGLGTNDRKLLDLGAMVHDVGRSIDEDEHPRIGSRMILADNWLPITPAERRALAYLTRFHRGGVPKLGEDDILYPGDALPETRLLLGLLRAADALDSRAIESPRLSLTIRGRRLMVTCFLSDDSARARKTYTRRKKFRLLEDLLHCRVDVDVRSTEDAALAV